MHRTAGFTSAIRAGKWNEAQRLWTAFGYAGKVLSTGNGFSLPTPIPRIAFTTEEGSFSLGDICLPPWVIDTIRIGHKCYRTTRARFFAFATMARFRRTILL